MIHPVLLNTGAASVAVMVAQSRPDINLVEGLPFWIVTALWGISITLWFLNQAGKLPWSRPDEVILEESPEFRAVDQHRLEQLYYLLAQRDDEGIERFLKFAQEARRSYRTLDKIKQASEHNNEVLEQILKELKKQR